MSTENFQHQIQGALSKLHTLRDEIRVRIHLGSLDWKDKWSELEGRLHKAEGKARHASAEALKALHELITKFEELGNKLGKSEPLGGGKGVSL